MGTSANHGPDTPSPPPSCLIHFGGNPPRDQQELNCIFDYKLCWRKGNMSQGFIDSRVSSLSSNLPGSLGPWAGRSLAPDSLRGLARLSSCEVPHAAQPVPDPVLDARPLHQEKRQRARQEPPHQPLDAAALRPDRRMRRRSKKSATPGSPPCAPAFTGDNGGATSKGVSADEIRSTWQNWRDGKPHREGETFRIVRKK